MKYCVAFLLFLGVLNHQVYAQDTVQVHAGWNLIGSLNSGISPAELVSVPPGIIISSMFGYNPEVGYAAAMTLEKGRGYWVKMSADGMIIFSPPIPPGTANISWTLVNSQIIPGFDTPADCPLLGNVEVAITGPTHANTSGPCSTPPLVVPGLVAGTYTFDLLLTDPVNHPGQSAAAQVMADVIAGNTADIQVIIDCTFCPGQ